MMFFFKTNKISKEGFFFVFGTFFAFFALFGGVHRAFASEIIKIVPSSFSGVWLDAVNVFSQDLSEESGYAAFSEENSAHPADAGVENTAQEGTSQEQIIPSESWSDAMRETGITEEESSSEDETNAILDETTPSSLQEGEQQNPLLEDEKPTGDEQTTKEPVSEGVPDNAEQETSETLSPSENIPEEQQKQEGDPISVKSGRISAFLAYFLAWTEKMFGIGSVWAQEEELTAGSRQSAVNEPKNTPLDENTETTGELSTDVQDQVNVQNNDTDENESDINNTPQSQADEKNENGKSHEQVPFDDNQQERVQAQEEEIKENTAAPLEEASKQPEQILDEEENIEVSTSETEIPSEASKEEVILTLGGFYIPPEIVEGKLIENIQLRLSIAGKGPLGDALGIEYRLGAEQWSAWPDLDISLEVSNKTNGGYLLYSLPTLQNLQDLANLEVRFIYKRSDLTEITPSDTSRVYLDAVWLEIETRGAPERDLGEEIELFFQYLLQRSLSPNFFALKKTWKSEESPEVDIHDMMLTKEMVDYDSAEGQYALSITLFGPEGNEIDLGQKYKEMLLSLNHIKLDFFDLPSFRPGMYKMKIKVRRYNEEITQERDFAWGVLALNVNKSIYLPNEQAYIQMAALDPEGHTVCDAMLTLEIVNFKGEKDVLSTETGEIVRNPACGPDNIIQSPDYYAYYRLQGASVYNMRLLAKTIHGENEILSYMIVRDAVPFDIEREGPTRINPTAPYDVKMSLNPLQDFSGEILEYVPMDFDVLNGNYQEVRFEQDAKRKMIVWNMSLSSGQRVELQYRFDAPDISPALALLGPLQLFDAQKSPIFQETRQWEIASDALSTSTTTITTSTDEGLGGSDESWTHRVFHDPNNDRWHVLYIDSGSDIHSASSGDDDGVTWTDGADIVVGTYDYDDFDCALETDGSTTYLHCVYSTSADNNLYYVRSTLSGASPFISIGTEQTVYSASDSLDDVIHPHIAVDSSDCGLIIADIRDDSILLAANEHQIYLWKEASTCGDGTWTTATNFPKTGVQTSLGYAADLPTGIVSYGDNDAQLYWIDSDTVGTYILLSNHFDGDVNSMGTERTLEADVEGDNAAVNFWSVIFSTTNVTFAMDDGTTDLDAYIITTKDGALGSQVDTVVNTTYSSGNSLQTVTAAVDTNASGGNDLWVFGSNNTDPSDIYYNTSTDGGATWGGSATLWVNSYDTSETKYLSAGYNSENCDILVSWIGNAASPWNINTKAINTGSCPPTTAQNHYRFRDDTYGLNTNNGWQYGEDTLYSGLPKSTTIRLRAEIANTGSGAAENVQYRLEYAVRTGATCGDESFTTVPDTASTEHFQMVLSGQYANGDSITTSLLTGVGTWANGYGVEEPGNSSSSHTLTDGYYSEFEYAFEATSNATDGEVYCFRLTNAGSTTNFSYSIYPQLSLATQSNVVVSSVSLNSGSSITLTENTTTQVSATATVTDANGYADIDSANGVIYLSSVSGGKDCTLNDNDCYKDTVCDLTGCAGNSCTATCTVSMQFHADPTDTNTPWSSSEWNAYVEAYDGVNTGYANNVASQDIEVNSLLGLDVSALSYGALAPGGSNDPLDKTVTVTATGNVALDITLYGTNLTSGGNSLDVGQQKYSLSSGTAYGSGTVLSVTPGVEVELECLKTTSAASKATKTVYWGLSVPLGTKGGSYTGTNTFEAVKDELPWP